MEKYEFSHEDYLMYQFHFVNEKENQILGTASKVRCQKHDKTFKEVLKDKKRNVRIFETIFRTGGGYK